MKTFLNEKLECLLCHGVISLVITVCESLMFVCDVLGITKTAEVPSGPLNRGELPATVPKGIRSDALEELSGRDDRSKPGLTGKQIVE